MHTLGRPASRHPSDQRLSRRTCAIVGIIAAGLAGAVPREMAAQSGSWDAVRNWPAIATHTSVLSNGKVLFWRGAQGGAAVTNTYVWDPVSNTVQGPLAATKDMFCSGHAALMDGRTIEIGGNRPAVPPEQGFYGITITNFFDPAAGTWASPPLPEMEYERWYPTATTLPDGKVLATSGLKGYFSIVTQEVYDPATNTWKALGGTVQDCGGGAPFSCRTGDQYLPIYPYMFVLPNGKLFQAGAENGCPSIFGQPICDPSQTRILDMSSTCATNGCMWTTVGTAPTASGSAAMYRPGKVLKSGGHDRGADAVYGTADDFVSAQAHVIDMTAASPAWRSIAPMAFPRSHHTLVLLPDGNALAVGGTTAQDQPQNAVLASELWNATTETWTTLASMSVPRMYHSTAVLLPDARVLAAGGDNYPSAQVFSPPYLAAGTRPTVTSAPATVIYTQTFTVSTPDGPTIQSAALVRTGSVTHAFDQNQRYVPVAFTATSGGLSVTAPSDGNVAPPGYYMLFVVNANGAPSVAKLVQLRGCG